MRWVEKKERGKERSGYCTGSIKNELRHGAYRQLKCQLCENNKQYNKELKLEARFDTIESRRQINHRIHGELLDQSFMNDGCEIVVVYLDEHFKKEDGLNGVT